MGATLDRGRAAFWGEFVQVAYQMFADDKKDLNPSQPRVFPDGWALYRNISMQHGILKACRSEHTSPTHVPKDSEELIGFIARKENAKLADYGIVFRGTNDISDLATDLQVRQMPAPKPLVGKTEEGFTRMYHTMEFWDPKNPGSDPTSGNGAELLPDAGSVTVTGHSLGAALAILHGAILASTERFPDLEVYTLAAAKVGDSDFVREFDSLVPKSCRVYNLFDPVGFSHGPWPKATTRLRPDSRSIP